MVPATRGRLLLVGSAGVVGTLLRPMLEAEYEVVGLDLAAGPGVDLVGDIGEAGVCEAAMPGVGHVVHLATGASGGWAGLLRTDIAGTRNLLAAAARAGVTRFVYASSNHAVGRYELDRSPAIWLEDHPAQLPAWTPPQPDGEYGAAKVAAEALAYRYSREAGLPCSSVRIGTVRRAATIEDALATEDWSWVSPDPDLVRARLARTWCDHHTLRDVFKEELDSTDRYRVRYAMSATTEAFWSADVHVVA